MDRIVLLLLCLLSWPVVAVDVYLSEQKPPITLAAESINQAKKDVKAVVYKFSSDVMRKAVLNALERGVKVTLIVDEKEAYKSKSHIGEIQKAGATVIFWTVGKLHAKFFVVDDQQAVAGSFNWSRSAQSKNTEIVLVFDDPSAISQFTQAFTQLFKSAQ
ncbi:Phospholipase D [BD1-7 clade bacterium]|uniref:phospholipase D n=1 Tax=BD1-7 clade bacterium TaxID=2029982 RepID=A0A5S9PXV4_9GAMM|nr:Phospholipase D [BD1-7 clade bacterium]CAA0109487.1 Phospholipase D [BD1-7 clade bacterium]